MSWQLDNTTWAVWRRSFLSATKDDHWLEFFRPVKLQNDYMDEKMSLRASIHKVVSRKWVKYQFWVNYLRQRHAVRRILVGWVFYFNSCLCVGSCELPTSRWHLCFKMDIDWLIDPLFAAACLSTNMEQIDCRLTKEVWNYAHLSSDLWNDWRCLVPVATASWISLEAQTWRVNESF